MRNIPLWGKIAGGCGILLVLFLLFAGFVGIFLLASSNGPEPTSSPETTTSQEEETEEETPTPTEETTVPEEPEVDATGVVNTCIPDQDQAMAEVVAAFTSSDVTIYADEVYVVAVDEEISSFYVVAGSDVGTIIIYIEGSDTDEPMGYAANDIAYDYTQLVYPEDLGAEPIDTESESFQVAEGCVS